LTIKSRKIPWESYSWLKFWTRLIIDFLCGAPHKLISHFEVEDFNRLYLCCTAQKKNSEEWKLKEKLSLVSLSSANPSGVILVELCNSEKWHFSCEIAAGNKLFSTV